MLFQTQPAGHRGPPDTRPSADFRAAFEEAPYPILLADDDRRFLAGNRVAREFLGVMDSELRTLRIDDVASDAARETIDERWRSFLAGGETSGRFQLDGDAGPQWVEFRTTLNYAPGQHLAILHPERRFEPAEGRLSRREREILTLLATGLSARQIARDLVLEPTTVATHLRNARQKLGARTRAEAIATALREGEIQP